MTTVGRQQRFPTFAESCLWKCEVVRANGGLRVSLRTHTIGHNRTQRLLIQSGHSPATVGQERSPIGGVKRSRRMCYG
jgi:hypothetical protein